jgi:hypothetical protein
MSDLTTYAAKQGTVRDTNSLPRKAFPKHLKNRYLKHTATSLTSLLCVT